MRARWQRGSPTSGCGQPGGFTLLDPAAMPAPAPVRQRLARQGSSRLQGSDPARVRRGCVCWSRFPPPCRTEAPTEARQGCHRPLKADGYGAALPFTRAAHREARATGSPSASHRPSAAAASWSPPPRPRLLPSGSSIRARGELLFSAHERQRFAAQVSVCFEPVSPAKSAAGCSAFGLAVGTNLHADRRLFRRLFRIYNIYVAIGDMGSEKSRESH
eukprot:COSAG06_NODE_1190_length_10329_cov_3.609422_5_plen_217_part_00